MATRKRAAKETSDAPAIEGQDQGAVEVPVEQPVLGEAETEAKVEADTGTTVEAEDDPTVEAEDESDVEAASEADVEVEQGVNVTAEEQEDEDLEDEELDVEAADEDEDEDEQPAPRHRVAATSRDEPRGRGYEPRRDFTHLNESGRARMVDVGEKPDTQRGATARGLVRMRPETLGLIRSGGIYKGDVLAVAQVAGVMAAKRTPDVIPLCHTLLLTGVDLEFQLDERVPGVEITATVRTTGKTGAEMEALTAVSAAALTIYDMCKSVDRDMAIDRVRLLHKAGGRSGEFRRPDEDRRWEDRPRRWEDRPRQWEDRPPRRWEERPRGTWPQHPRRRFDEGEGGPPRPPRERYEREPRTGPPSDQRWRRDDQRQGFDRPARRPWRPDDPRDRRRGRYDGD